MSRHRSDDCIKSLAPHRLTSPATATALQRLLSFLSSLQPSPASSLLHIPRLCYCSSSHKHHPSRLSLLLPAYQPPDFQLQYLVASFFDHFCFFGLAYLRRPPLPYVIQVLIQICHRRSLISFQSPSPPSLAHQAWLLSCICCYACDRFPPKSAKVTV